MRSLLPLVLFAATFSLGLGLALPLIRIDRLLLFTDEPSLLAIVSGLWDEGEKPLSLVILMFSAVFPCLKLGLLHVAAYGGRDAHHRVPAWLRALSNWSMLDVVLVALVVFAAKTSGLATALTQSGLWFFAASAVLTVTASALLKRENA
ncbi:MAG TPA: paraquat-inducible protein A [Rhizobiaceae bacterium]